MRATFALVLALCSVVACKDRDVAGHPAFEKDPDRERPESDIVRVQVPVPPGKQVACADLLDPEGLSAMLGEELDIEDRASTKPDATSVCGLMRTGSPPSAAVQKRRSEKTGLLGVLPGDELCTIEAYCSTPSSIEGLLDRCGEGGDQVNEDLRVPACVHQTQRGPKWAYTYRVFDDQTSCVLRVLGGPSVTDEDLVQRCTNAALTTIGPDDLARYE